MGRKWSSGFVGRVWLFSEKRGAGVSVAKNGLSMTRDLVNGLRVSR